ncbi:MAG TPA: hypothetical protein VM784_02090, partial [Actinomycetota bacterium]|nr:hypothetical protein [Actinomycetota bacterium]
KVGPLHYNTVDDNSKRSEPANIISEDVARTIDAEIRAVIEEGRARAAEVLKSCRRTLDALVEVLLEKETLSAIEIQEIYEKTARARTKARAGR